MVSLFNHWPLLASTFHHSPGWLLMIGITVNHRPTMSVIHHRQPFIIDSCYHWPSTTMIINPRYSHISSHQPSWTPTTIMNHQPPSSCTTCITTHHWSPGLHLFDVHFTPSCCRGGCLAGRSAVLGIVGPLVGLLSSWVDGFQWWKDVQSMSSSGSKRF